MNPPSFAPFERRQFLLLTTFRKNGNAVPTPVWFVLYADKILVWTGAATGKVKRLRNNSQASIAPCTYAGKILGETIPAHARVLSEEESAPLVAAFERKYGWQFRLIRWQNQRRGAKHILLEITVD